MENQKPLTEHEFKNVDSLPECSTRPLNRASSTPMYGGGAHRLRGRRRRAQLAAANRRWERWCSIGIIVLAYAVFTALYVSTGVPAAKPPSVQTTDEGDGAGTRGTRGSLRGGAAMDCMDCDAISRGAVRGARRLEGGVVCCAGKGAGPSPARMRELKAVLQLDVASMRSDMSAYVRSWANDVLRTGTTGAHGSQCAVMIVGGATVAGNEGYGTTSEGHLNYMRAITGTLDGSVVPNLRIRGRKGSHYLPMILLVIQRVTDKFGCRITATEAAHEVVLDLKTWDADNEKVSYKNLRNTYMWKKCVVCQEWEKLMNDALILMLESVAAQTFSRGQTLVAVVAAPFGGVIGNVHKKARGGLVPIKAPAHIRLDPSEFILRMPRTRIRSVVLTI